MRLRIPLLAGLCLLVTLCAAAPAGAVIGGEALDEAQVPWFANLDCGGSLVAPDRVLTAAHCVGDTPASRLGVTVAGRPRTVAGVSLYGGGRRANGPENYLDDVAVMVLGERVEGVPIATLGGQPDRAMKIIGRGEDESSDAVLRQATLRTLSDRACANAYRHHRGDAGERFDGSRMTCAIDPDGRAPLSSGCFGDSGGPLMAGSYDAPRVLGVVSWGGAGCGADHLPTVFAEVRRYRSFILSPHPVLAPQATGAAKVQRKGRRLTCITPAFTNRPTKVAITWERWWLGFPTYPVGHHRQYTLRKADRARRLSCIAEASNAGGHTSAVSLPLRIPR